MVTRELLSQRVGEVLTALRIRKRGYFTPYAYVSSVSDEVSCYDAVEALFAQSQDRFRTTIADFAKHTAPFQAAVDEGRIPYEEGGMFPKLDAFAAYHLTRELRPKRILEIGSGASTHILSQALADNGKGSITCIDPQPRRSIDRTGAKIFNRTLTEADADLVRDFEANDILFIDSSHIMLPGMDVDIQFNRMFPALPIGTVVHVHDIFLPDNYPPNWSHRRYSEQNALMGWILSGFFEVVFPAYYVATRLEEDLTAPLGPLLPQSPARNAGSIWLRRVGGAS